MAAASRTFDAINCSNSLEDLPLIALKSGEVLAGC
jgi:hypothetical protein